MNTLKVKFDKNGRVVRVIGDVGPTRMGRAAYALHQGEIEQTFGYKLRRFCRRVGKTFNAKIDEYAAIAHSEDEAAEDVPFIGLEVCRALHD